LANRKSLPPEQNLDASAERAAHFREFLQQVANAKATVADWNRFAVTHYDDPKIERLRAKLVHASLRLGQCSARVVNPDLAEFAQVLFDELQ
jgi:hypothetical protein